MSMLDPPVALLAELSHRCPLRCPYCSNPLNLTRAHEELDTSTWVRVLDEAGELGCMQVHFSGGEPLARDDLEVLVAAAARAGLYTNLITSGVLLDAPRLQRLARAGLEHVQLSFQDADPESADVIAGKRGAHAQKLAAAKEVREAGLALTANFVVHRANIERVGLMIRLGAALGAARIEIANVQYHGWALVNRAALLPTRDEIEHCEAVVHAAKEEFRGSVTIDFVAADYYARWPKPCMGGWGRRFIVVTPSGKVLPCHAAETISGLTFESARDHSLARIWRESAAFNAFRGTGWMKEPCRSCARAEQDFGGCRCQAFAVAGDVALADATCHLSPSHDTLRAIVASSTTHHYTYRGFGGAQNGSTLKLANSASPPNGRRGR